MSSRRDNLITKSKIIVFAFDIEDIHFFGHKIEYEFSKILIKQSTLWLRN